MLLTALAGLVIGGLLLVLATRCEPRAAPEPVERRTGERAFDAELPDDVDPGAIGAPMPPRFTGRLRLASLSPAMSRVLVDMGLEASIVGRSGFCRFLDPDIPVAGDLLRVDAERLVALDPTHVLRQPPARDDASGLRRLAADRGWAPPITARLNGIADVRAFVRTLPRELAPPTSPMEAALAARADAIDARLAALVEPPAGGDRVPTGADPAALDGGVLLAHAVRPPGVFGRGTYLHEMLAARGFANAFGGLGWRTLATEDLVRLDPAAIVLVTDRPREVAELVRSARDAWADLGLRALATGRLAVLGHADALRPSSGLIEVGAALDAALREVVAGDVDGPATTDDGAGPATGAPTEDSGPDAAAPGPGDRIGPADGPPAAGDPRSEARR